MQIQQKVNDRVTVVADGENPMELFQQLSSLQEVFGENCCGKCGGTNLTYRIRKAQKGKDEYDYPEMVCHSLDIKTGKACYAKLSFGQGDDGILFPVRFQREGKVYVKDADGKNIPKGANGWVRYNFEKKCEE